MEEWIDHADCVSVRVSLLLSLLGLKIVIGWSHSKIVVSLAFLFIESQQRASWWCIIEWIEIRGETCWQIEQSSNYFIVLTKKFGTEIRFVDSKSIFFTSLFNIRCCYVCCRCSDYSRNFRSNICLQYIYIYMPYLYRKFFFHFTSSSSCSPLLYYHDEISSRSSESILPIFCHLRARSKALNQSINF